MTAKGKKNICKTKETCTGEL